jgi:hypothetical protein
MMAISAAAGIGLALAGCADNAGTSGASPSGSASGASPSSGGTVASCVVGTWRTTGIDADAASRRNNVSAALTGGAGISVKISEIGATNIDFSGMEPVNFNAKVAGATVRGKFTYGGTAAGHVSTGPAPAGSATPAPTGSWAPVGDLNWGETKLTLDLTEPVQARPFDNTPIGRYVGSDTGNAVDIDPIFDKGTYTCGGDTLTITPDDDADISWTLKRS